MAAHKSVVEVATLRLLLLVATVAGMLIRSCVSPSGCAGIVVGMGIYLGMLTRHEHKRAMHDYEELMKIKNGEDESL